MSAPSPNEILRFKRSERMMHWSFVPPFIICYFSALVLFAIYNPDPTRPYREVFSWIHRVSAIFLIVLPPLAVLVNIRDFKTHLHNIKEGWLWTFSDVKWLALIGLSAINKNIKLPEEGKFNAGEKLNFMVVMTSTPLFILSGAVIWYLENPILPWLLHVFMAVLVTPLMMGHMFMAVINPSTRKGLSGMISGYVDKHWASHHYRRWYKQEYGVEGEATSPSPAVEEPQAQPPETESSQAQPPETESPQAEIPQPKKTKPEPTPEPVQPKTEKPTPAKSPAQSQPEPEPVLSRTLSTQPEKKPQQPKPVSAKAPQPENKTKSAQPRKKPIESKPIESKPIESKPIESKPIKSKPIKSKPIESKPVESKPVESKPVESKPIESKPIESKPIESKPIESKPVEPKPVKPANQSKPVVPEGGTAKSPPKTPAAVAPPKSTPVEQLTTRPQTEPQAAPKAQDVSAQNRSQPQAKADVAGKATKTTPPGKESKSKAEG